MNIGAGTITYTSQAIKRSLAMTKADDEETTMLFSCAFASGLASCYVHRASVEPAH